MMFICMAMLRVGLGAHLFCISQISQRLISAQPNICLCLAEIRIFLCFISFSAFPRLDETSQMHQYLPHICLFFCILATCSIMQFLRGLICYFFVIHVVHEMGQVFPGTCVWGGVREVWIERMNWTVQVNMEIIQQREFEFIEINW